MCGYSDDSAPWRFAGRALYQLNLVKSSEARKHVPADLKLVELFGYTLGGVYLARYEDSPAGTFDEMVALGGLVWNAPTSCAWAARVYVNNKDARKHGVETCGLPSNFAHFDEEGAGAAAATATATTHGWWKNTKKPRGTFFGLFNKQDGDKRQQRKQKKTKQQRRRGGGGGGGESLQLRDENGEEVCTLDLPPAAPSLPGPRIKMALPSFSGRTDKCPDLLKYSLELRANVRLSHPIIPQGAEEQQEEEEEKATAMMKNAMESGSGDGVDGGGGGGDGGGEGGFLSGLWEPQGVRRFPPQAAMAAVTLSSTGAAAASSEENNVAVVAASRKREPMKDVALAAIIEGKPLLCIAFDRMEMDVGSPQVVGGK